VIRRIKVRAISNVVVHQSIDPDVIIAEQDAVATNTATGVDFAFGFVLIIRIKRSQIAHVLDYTDNLTIANALGRPPAVS
jgi:ketosteroid isomerase-like protein